MLSTKRFLDFDRDRLWIEKNAVCRRPFLYTIRCHGGISRFQVCPKRAAIRAPCSIGKIGLFPDLRRICHQWRVQGNSDIRCTMHEFTQCGLSGLMHSQLLLKQHFFAVAAVFMLRCSLRRGSGRSKLKSRWISDRPFAASCSSSHIAGRCRLGSFYVMSRVEAKAIPGQIK